MRTKITSRNPSLSSPKLNQARPVGQMTQQVCCLQSGNRLTGTETEFNQLAKQPCLKVEVVLAAMV
jgi:hypothetical protein